MFVYFSLQLYPKVKDNLRPLAITILLLPLSLSCLKFTNVWFTTEKKKKWNKTMKFWIENWPTCFKFLTRKMMETHATKTIFISFLYMSMILYSQNNSITAENHRQHTIYTVYNVNQRAFIQQFTNERTRGSLWGTKSESDFTNRWNRPDNRQII